MTYVPNMIHIYPNKPLKDLEIERQELRKTVRKCVDDCGYNNF